jgi:hypothetical protein
MHKFTYFILFFATFISRIVFKLISGYDNFQLFGDSVRYDILSDRIINDDHNMDFIAFIISPLYPYTLAVFKWLFSENWQTSAVIFQFFLVSLSTVYLTKTALLLFDKQVAIITGVTYILYPFTLYYNFTLSQETSFQAYFIISIYFLLKYLHHKQLKSLIISAIFFSLSFLTKSHALLYAPFIAILIFFYQSTNYLNFIGAKHIMIYGFICLLFTLPGGLANLNIHNTYTLSGMGAKTFFHNGNSQQNYDFVFNNVGLNNDDELAFIFDTNYIDAKYGAINKLPHVIKQDYHFELALAWIKNNPNEFFRLKLYSLYRFFSPGVTNKHGTLKLLIGLIISLPLFLVSYLSIYYNLRNNFSKHAWIFFLQISMLIFFLVFIPQTRFRVITLEAFYIIYFAFFASKLFSLSKNNQLTESLVK